MLIEFIQGFEESLDNDFTYLLFATVASILKYGGYDFVHGLKDSIPRY
jgi:hypothetical protein